MVMEIENKKGKIELIEYLKDCKEELGKYIYPNQIIYLFLNKIYQFIKFRKNKFPIKIIILFK